MSVERFILILTYGWKTTANSVAHRRGDILLDANYGNSGENFRGKDFLWWHLYLSLFFFWGMWLVLPHTDFSTYVLTYLCTYLFTIVLKFERSKLLRARGISSDSGVSACMATAEHCQATPSPVNWVTPFYLYYLCISYVVVARNNPMRQTHNRND